MRKILLSLLGVVFAVAMASAHINPSESQAEAPNNNNKVTFRESCNAAKAQRDQAVNNVRARLLTGGDVWWDGSGDGRYVVPKVPPGVPEVSSLYAGAVWLGGVDEAGNLKVAAQTYSSRGEDFSPGPLYPEREKEDDPDPGTTDEEVCAQWDAFFVVTGAEIDEHIGNYEQVLSAGGTYEPSSIPKGVRGWPGRGNPFFLDVNGFELPNTSQGLAGFWDEDGDGLYNPQNGDYPVIEIRGCLDEPQYPDEMIFWIYNDNGNIHAQSNGDPIQMEIQVQAFGYATNDELNDMTFQRYKLINRAIEPIDSAFFAMWVDPDLGCYTDDYIGCDTLRSLAVVYNEDVLDGQTGCSCPGGVNTYCDEVPALGIDYFRGPLGPKVFGPNGTLLNPGRGEEPDTIIELGMSSFTYFNNTAPGNWPAAMQDPGNALEYYRYLTGSWRDGSPFTYGGDAYQGGEPIRYAFTEAPDDPNGWSMCTAGLGEGDRRTIQASGPFRLDPGAVNELIIGVVWVPDQSYPCPSIRRLQEADDIAQALFDNCFNITDGPDAPDLDIIELDRELIIVLTNDTVVAVSNNAFEEYEEVGLEIPSLAQDSFYRFEGYKIYQLNGANIGLSPENVDDPSKARLIYQVDVRNGVSQVFNWNTVDAPVEEDYYVPTLMVDGADDGIRHTFRVREDAFASEDRRLVNHKKYYFAAVAYAYNEYEPFDPKEIIGQRKPYLEGRRNIGPGGDGLPYTAIPRPIVDRQINADYGSGATITRIDGIGNGGNFIDLSDDTRAALEEAFSKEEKALGQLTYADGRGPINIQVFNPLDVKNGSFELRFVDSNPGDDVLDSDARWEMTLFPDDGSYRVVSEKTIAQLNEQIIRDFGFTVSIGQVSEPGSKDTEGNGYIPSEIAYSDETADPWYGFFPEGLDLIPEISFDDALFNYTSLKAGQIDAALDPDGGLAQYGRSPLLPYYILDWRTKGTSPFTGEAQFISPVWTNNSASGIVRSQMKLEKLNNVDLVFTSNKDLWSRCVVIETANRFYTDAGYPTEGNRKQFDLRAAPSVGKNADSDGLPMADGDGEGMGWFPGYAVDVETGQRLNVFWGENSVYDGSFAPELYDDAPAGRDMMFNPNEQIVQGSETFFSNPPLPYYFGGQHMVYVSWLPYDSCQIFRDNYKPGPSPLTKVKAMREITWGGMVVLQSGTQMLSYDEGLIPAKAVVKLRTNNPYQVEKDDGNADNGDQRTGTGENNYHPLYRFSIDGKEATALDQVQVNQSLDMIDVVPNPYYGFSDYETSQFTNTIKITNLPAKCVVTIYTLEGKFIRQYVRDEVGTVPGGNNRALNRNQIAPAIEWDLRNNKSIPVASGVYLIHVTAEGLGERTLKWFGVNREFDPSGL